MMNCKLAATGNVSLNQDERTSQLANGMRQWAGRSLQALRRLDKRAQRFFTAQAYTRSRKPARPQCGWQRYDSFC